jgi:hypothetical protein
MQQRLRLAVKRFNQQPCEPPVYEHKASEARRVDTRADVSARPACDAVISAVRWLTHPQSMCRAFSPNQKCATSIRGRTDLQKSATTTSQPVDLTTALSRFGFGE